MAALNHLVQLVFHIVAQIVEAVFVIRAVGNVAGIGLGALDIVQSMHNDADGQAEEIINPPHVFRVAAGEIIVDRDDMDALAAQGVEVAGESRDQRLALAGLHFRDRAFMEHHAPDELHVEMALSEGPLGRLAHRRKSRNEQIVEVGAGGDLGAEFVGARPQGLIRKGGDFRLQGIDGLDPGPIGLQAAFIGRAENFLRKISQHSNDLSYGFRTARAEIVSRGGAVPMSGARALRTRRRPSRACSFE